MVWLSAQCPTEGLALSQLITERGWGCLALPRQGPAWVWQALLSSWHQGSVAERWLGWLRMSPSTPASQHLSFTARKTKCKHHKVQWKLPYCIYSFITCSRFTVQWARTRECKYFLIIWGKNKIKVKDVLCLSFLWRGQEFAVEGERFFFVAKCLMVAVLQKMIRQT